MEDPRVPAIASTTFHINPASYRQGKKKPQGDSLALTVLPPGDRLVGGLRFIFMFPLIRLAVSQGTSTSMLLNSRNLWLSCLFLARYRISNRKKEEFLQIQEYPFYFILFFYKVFILLLFIIYYVLRRIFLSTFFKYFNIHWSIEN